LPQIRVLLRRQRTQAALRATATRHALQQLRRRRETLQHRGDVGTPVAGDLGDLGVRLALLAQHHHLPPQFQANLGGGATTVRLLRHGASSHRAPLLSNSLTPG
jgi:hypothetical protein